MKDPWRYMRRAQRRLRARSAPGAWWPSVVLRALASYLLGPLSCGRDPADRKFFAALGGEKRGTTTEDLIPHLDRANVLEPKRAIYWEKRGDYREAQHDLVLAKAALDRAIEPADRPYLRFVRGLALCDGGRCAEALCDFDLPIAAQADNSEFYRGRGRARVRAERLGVRIISVLRSVGRP